VKQLSVGRDSFFSDQYAVAPACDFFKEFLGSGTTNVASYLR